jgi:hypothetical protein
VNRFARLFPLLALALAACQPLPHPFEDAKPAPLAPAMRPPDAAGIVVDPVTGAPAPTAVALAEAMADALRKEDVPADTKIGNTKSYHLAGTAQASENGQSMRVTVVWALRGPDGRVVGEETASDEVPSDVWRDGGKDLAKELSAKPALALAARIEGDVPVEKPVHDPVVALKPVTGAPGDGGNALSRAIGAILARAGVALKSKPADQENYLLSGKVEINPVPGGKQSVKITWSLARPDGSAIGQVSQENQVPAGSLDGAWGDVAYEVATAAAGGIVELIQRAQATTGS